MEKSIKNIDMLPDILTAQNIADYLKISRKTVYGLLQLKPTYGGIPNFPIGTSKRVRKEDLISWIDGKVQ